MKETIGLKGEVELVVLDKYGNVKDRRKIKNVIVNAGKAEVANLIIGGGTPFSYIAIGTGTGSASATDTALGSETHRVSAATSRVTTNVSNDTAQLVATFSGYSGTEAVTESGVFNASSGGTMLCRQTFSALNIDWDAGDSLQVTWKIVVS